MHYLFVKYDNDDDNDSNYFCGMVSRQKTFSLIFKSCAVAITSTPWHLLELC